MATEISELSGVGPATVKKLDAAGIDDMGALAEADLDELTEAGVSESKAGRLVRAARENTVIIQSGDEVEDEYERKETLSTGMDALDDAVGGGWKEGSIITLSGETGTGKTQVAFQSLVRAVEQTGKPAVYIETEPDRYQPDRLRSLADEPDIQEQIHRVKAYDLDRQENAYGAVLNQFDDVSIIVVDSFTAQFRLSDEFEDRGSLQDRSTVMGRHLGKLGTLARTLNAPALITAQQYGNPGQYGKSSYTYGGSLMQHTVFCEVEMGKAGGEIRSAQIRNHPGEKEKEIMVEIGDGGLDAWVDS